MLKQMPLSELCAWFAYFCQQGRLGPIESDLDPPEGEPVPLTADEEIAYLKALTGG